VAGLVASSRRRVNVLRARWAISEREAGEQATPILYFEMPPFLPVSREEIT
jgi:hypothetical protein